MEIIKGQPNVNSKDENTTTNIKNSLDMFNNRLDTAERKSISLKTQQQNRSSPNLSTKKNKLK